MNWTFTAESRPFNDVASNGASTFLMVGGNGVVAQTTDGVNETNVTNVAGNTEGFATVAFGAGKWVAAGSRTYSSTDGTSWATTQATSANNIYDVVATDGSGGAALFVTAGSRGDLLATWDGLAFTRYSVTTPNPGDVWSVLFVGGRFVAIGSGWQATSPTGSTWTATTIPCINKTRFGNSLFVGIDCGSQMVHTAPSNLSAWTSGTTLPNTLAAADIAFGAGLFVIIGHENGVPGAVIFSSPDGTTWTQRTVQLTGTASSINYVNGQFIATTWNGELTVSQDGMSWGAPLSGPMSNGSPVAVASVGYDGTRYLVGAANQLNFSTFDFVTYFPLPGLPANNVGTINRWARSPTGKAIGVGMSGTIITLP
jgi:hypothetical protein